MRKTNFKNDIEEMISTDSTIVSYLGDNNYQLIGVVGDEEEQIFIGFDRKGLWGLYALRKLTDTTWYRVNFENQLFETGSELFKKVVDYLNGKVMAAIKESQKH